MKKTLMVIMMALLAVSVAFAGELVSGTVGAPGTTPGTDKTLTASLELTSDNFAGYNFGFSSTEPANVNVADNNDVGNVTAAETVTISYKSAGNADSTGSPIYYYYKVRAVNKVTLTLTADILKQEGHPDVTLPYTVTGAGKGFNTTKSVERDGVPLMTAEITAHTFDYDSGLMTFNVTGLNAGNIGKYKAVITYNIVSAA